jgi:hypothetical protein
MIFFKFFFSTTFLLQAPLVLSFVQIYTSRIHTYLSGNLNDDYSTDEVRAMDELIVSLSLMPSDESRRKRAVEIFDKELAKPNGAPKRFADLFDAVLAIVGDRVQSSAKLRASETHKQNTEEDSTLDFMSRSYDERQLWALVDLMVQSKTIVKKAAGTLGNNGSFT